MHVCPMVTGVVPHVGGPIATGFPTVMIGFMPAARVGDMAVCCGPPDAIARGSMTVFIGNMPAARIGDPTMHGGIIAMGCPTVMIGDVGMGGAGAAAAALAAAAQSGAALAGRGPGAARTNGPFATQDEAARAALQAANPQSIRENREYSGLIYRGTDGQYYYTGPARGSETGANPWRDAPVPAGTQEVGYYHTHGDYSTIDPATGAAVRTSDPSQDQFNSDRFSTTDRKVATNRAAGIPGYTGYLGTPSGTFRRYDPATGSDTTL